MFEKGATVTSANRHRIDAWENTYIRIYECRRARFLHGRAVDVL